jgi:alcohol dehydrogenase (cytochrome c)
MTDPKGVSRRQFVAATAVTAAGVSAVTTGTGASAAPAPVVHNRGVFAQDAETPEAPALPEGPPPDVNLDGSDWSTIYGNYQGHRVARASTISANNIDTLGPAWRLKTVDDAGNPAAMTGTPIVVGTTIYYSDMNSNIYAIDRETSELKWSRMFNIPTNGPNGVAYGYGNIYSGLGESGEVIALNAETGEDVWHVQLTNMAEEGIRMAPTVYGGFVYISIVPLSTNNNPGSRGILHALDARTGNTVWYFDLAVDNLWGNARVNMGAGLWYPPTFDEDGNLYFGNGNAAPWPGNEEFPSASSRRQSNLYASTAMSLDPKTASVRWYFEPKPFDLFDLDYQIAPSIVDVEINGVPTRVAICAGKTGDVVAVNANHDRDDAKEGGILWWTKVGKHENDQLQQLPFDHAIRVFPGSNGGVLTPPAVADGVYYCVITNRPTWHTATGTERGHQDPFEGEVVAIDVTNGNILWQVDLPTFPTGSIVVSNDLVITAGLDGLVRAFLREDGTQVWNFQLTAGVNAPVIIAGDELIVSAGTALRGEPDQFEGGEPPEAVFEMVSFKLGVGGGEVPESTPAMHHSTPEDASPAPDAGIPADLATPAAGADGALSITVTAVDIAFEPNQFSIPADTPVTVVIPNTGAMQHDFMIDDPEVYSGMIPSGETGEVTLNLPAGTYRFYCTVEGHADAGMIGTVYVS